MVLLSAAIIVFVPLYLSGKWLFSHRQMNQKKRAVEAPPAGPAEAAHEAKPVAGPAFERRRWVQVAAAIMLCAALSYQVFMMLQISRLRSTNPEDTPLIRARARQAVAEGKSPQPAQTWVPYEQISPSLKRAVVVGEDPDFFSHHGFDWKGIRRAIEENWRSGNFKKGNSTISQQVAKNLFLSQSRTILRKADEVLITIEIEALLSKRRILELYLNVIEWGDGIFGAEAAARHYFNTSAAALTDDQAAFLAAIIPAPLTTYNIEKNPKAVQERRAWIRGLLGRVTLQD
jgi:monofunctional biosynthetic peptidoglycan transglycosylase